MFLKMPLISKEYVVANYRKQQKVKLWKKSEIVDLIKIPSNEILKKEVLQ